MKIEGATADKTGLEIEEHGTTLIVRIDGGRHALFTRDIATQLGDLVDRPDKDPSIHAVVFIGAHPDRFLSHSDVTWLQEGGVGFPPINTRLAGVVSRMARVINKLPIVRSLAGMTRIRTLLELDRLHATLLKMNASGTIFVAALNGSLLPSARNSHGHVICASWQTETLSSAFPKYCSRLLRAAGVPND